VHEVAKRLDEPIAVDQNRLRLIERDGGRTPRLRTRATVHAALVSGVRGGRNEHFAERASAVRGVIHVDDEARVERGNA
jgi:hypothetical protein